MRRTLGKLFGYGWTAGLSGRGVALVFFGALALATLSVALGARVWPVRNDPAYSPPTSPAVRREGDRLVFDPPVAYRGDPTVGLHRFAYRSYLQIEPQGPPVADTMYCLGLSPEGVLLQGDKDKEPSVVAFTPSGYERAQRGIYGGIFLLVALVPFPVLWAAARLLILARKERGTSAPSTLRVVVRSYTPAFVYAGAAGLAFPVDQSPSIVFGTFFAAVGANLLFGVADGASPPPRPST